MYSYSYKALNQNHLILLRISYVHRIPKSMNIIKSKGGGGASAPKATPLDPTLQVTIIVLTALCPDPSNVTNGNVIFLSNSLSEVATYSCSEGFELVGDQNLTCTLLDSDSASFTPNVPTCIRK